MKSTFLGILGIIAAAFIIGCAGETKELYMRDTTGATKTIVFPNGTVFGGASKEQASTLAQIFVDSHNMHMQDMSEIKGMGKKSLENQQKLLELSSKNLETGSKNLETAQMALKMLEELSKRQGTGEITIFFPVGSAEIRKGALEFERLVNFSDYLSRESKGRKVILISIGSASAFGDRKLNERLGKKRSEAPVAVLDKYLVNIPHQFFKIYGIGDMYSPKNVTMKEHERYQHARIIAFFETDQIPTLPEEPK